jgi:glycosyltransferase involved in cell wall biosynthesis
MNISVIIPTFQPGEYIFDCLMSLENQTIDKQLFEVIIVLNGTKNPFFNRISDFISHLKLHSKFYYSEISGVSNARNIALNNVQSNYLAFIDDDDVVSATFLEGLFLKADNDSIVVSNSKTFKDDLNQTGENYITKTYNQLRDKKQISVLRGRHFFSNCCGKLIPASVIKGTRFDNNLKNGEDSVFMVEISRNISNVLIGCDDVVYFIRIRAGSASRKKKTNKEVFFSKLYELKKYFSFYLRFHPTFNIFFLSIMIAASLKSFVEDMYKTF